MKHRQTTFNSGGNSSLRLLLLAVGLCLGLVRLASAASVNASLASPTVALGETVALTISFDGVSSASPPPLPALPNFQVVGTSQSTEMNFANGVMQQRQNFTYQLSPRQAGDFTIPAFQVQTGGQTFTTRALALKVVRPGSSVPNAASGMPSVMLKLFVPRTQIYVGELLPVELRLYAQEGRLLEPPQILGDGFTVSKLSEPIQTQTVFSNQHYVLVTFRATVTAVKAGALALGPGTLALGVSDPNRPADFFGFRQQRRVPLAAEPVPIQVLPVPTVNVPPNYSGALGNFTLQVSAGPTNVTEGDPVTVKVQIAGRGQFESLALPPQPDWREFNTYSPSSTLVTNDGLGIACTKTFEQVVIPRNHEVKALPPLVFSFFDPEAKTFRTLTGRAIPLNVRPSAGAGGPLPTLAGLTNKTDQAEKPPEIAAIKVHLGAISPVEVPLFRQGWFLALQLVPPALWLSLLARRRFRESLARNPRLLRQRQVARTVSEGLLQLRVQATANQSDEFFATLVHLLQEQIGERLDVPASAITEAVVDERLRPLGLTPQTLAVLHGLFQKCNLARYAGTQSKGELSAVVEKVDEALAALKQLSDPEGK